MFTELLKNLIGSLSLTSPFLYCSVALAIVSALFLIRFIFRLFD